MSDQWLPESDASSFKSNGSSKPPLKVGVIGTRHVHAAGMAKGMIALGHTLVGAFESDASAAESWMELELAPLMSLSELLNSVDAVLVAGTNSERVEHSLAALSSDVAILAEKPAAIDAAAARELRDNAGDSLFMTALPIRFASAMHVAREAIRAGQIGTPLAGRGTNHGQYPGSWFGDPGLAGGGAIADHTVHVADGFCWLLDDHVNEVYAVAATKMHDLPVEDCGLIHLNFASGFFASLDASWSRPSSFHTWGDVWMEIVGTEGRIVIDPMARNMRLYDDRVGKLQNLGFGDDMTLAMLNEFTRYVRGERDNSPVSLREGLHASEIVLAAYRSIVSGQPERVHG